MTAFARLGLAFVTTTMSLAGCFFDFDRDLGLEPGDVAGRALRDEGVPAPYAKAQVEGTGRVYRTTSEGAFLVTGLVPGGWSLGLTDDKNGDGWPERAARRSFRVTMAPHKDGLFGESDARVTAVAVGDVALDGVVKARGRVTTTDGSPVVGARVYALRTVSLPGDADGQGALQVELGADADTASDVDGLFAFLALPAGALTFVAFDDSGAQLASPAFRVEAAPGDEVEVALTVALVPPTRPVRVELVPPPSAAELVKVHFTRPGHDPVGLAQGALDANDEPTFAGAESLLLQAPLGPSDVWVETSSGLFGVLRSQIASPGADVVTWGLLLLGRTDACAAVDDEGNAMRDCDHDDLQGLPPLADLEDPAISLWRECAPACADAFGESALAASCSGGGEIYDCDDDGDGQSDVTETLGCYGLGRGADPDGDGLCGLDDPYPQCRANDPAHESCRAGAPFVDFPPPVRPELAGGGVDGGPDDGGLLDGGPDDGGLLDGGLLDGGDDDGGSETDGGLVDAGVDGGPPAFVTPLDGAMIVDVEAVGDGAAVLLLVGAGVDLGPACTAAGGTGAMMIAFLDVWGACSKSVLVTAGVDSDFDLSDMAALSTGELAVVGHFSGELTITGGGASLPMSGSEAFVARDHLVFVVDQSGRPVRAVAGAHSGALNLNTVASVAALADGGLVLAATTTGNVTFPGLSGAVVLGNGDGADDAFVVALDATLAATWGHAFLSVGGSSAAEGLAVFNDGVKALAAVFVDFDGEVDFGGGAGVLNPADGAGGVALVALAANGAEAGTLSWHRRASGLDFATTTMTAVDGHGIVLAASTVNPVLLDGAAGGGGPTAPTQVGLSSFLAIYDGEGVLARVLSMPARDTDSAVQVLALDVTNGGDLLVAGHFSYGFDLLGVPVEDRDYAYHAFVTRLSGADGFETPLFVRRGYDDESFAADVQSLADDSILAGGTAFGPVFLGGFPLESQNDDGQPFLWRLLPDGESGEDLLLPFGDACLAQGACDTRQCDRPAWPTAEQGLCTSACDPAAPSCSTGATCHALELTPDVGVCVSAGSCFEDLHCDGGRCDPFTLTCEAGCSTASQCAVGEACHGYLGVCVPDCGGGGTCSDDEVCTPSAGGYFCHADCRLYDAVCGAAMCGSDGLCSDGSLDANGVYGDTWTWDGATRTWSYQEPTGVPGPRTGHLLGANGDGIVLVGGRDPFGTDIDASSPWLFANGEWSVLPSSLRSAFVTFGAAAGDATAGTGSFYLYAWNARSDSPVFARAACCGGSLATVSTTLPTTNRSHAAMAYDGQGRFFVFGGQSPAGATLGDLWVYDESEQAPAWVPVTTTGSAPEARYDHALSFAGIPGQLFLVGGRRADGGLLDDTWRLTVGVSASSATWTHVTTASVGPRAGHGMAYDGTQVMLYGGTTGRATPATRDMLVFDEGSASWSPPLLSAVPPTPRTFVRLSYDGSGSVVLYGGDDGPPPEHVRQDLFVGTPDVFGAVAWRQKTTTAPLAVDGAAFATAPDGSLWVFGGRDEHGGLTRQLYVYGAGGSVTDLTEPNSVITPREGAGMAFHPTTGALFLFGGRDATGFLQDLYQWSTTTNRFEVVAPQSELPSARAFGAMAPNAVNSAILLFGGEDSSGVHGDLWFLDDSGAFFPVVSAASPTARTEAAITSTAAGVFLFGGFGSNNFGAIDVLGDLWHWDGSGWTRLPSGGVTLGGATLTHEPGTSKLWLFGGNDTSAAYGELYVVDTATGTLSYTYMSSDLVPERRSRHAAGFVDGELLLIGGSDALRDLSSILGPG